MCRRSGAGLVAGISLLLSLLGCQSPKPAGQGLASVAAAVPYYNTPDFTPVWLTDSAIISRTITHRIAGFSLRNQANQLVSGETVRGKIYVANFFFTACPGICPRMTSLLRAVQDTFRAEPRVLLLSFSVTPWLDSVSRLRRYADSRGIQPGKWHLLTGERGAIYTLARRSYFAEDAIGFTRDSTEFLHTEHLILVDQRSRIRGVYNGTQPQEIDKLIEDMHSLLASANGQ
jgi:protein SCO1